VGLVHRSSDQGQSWVRERGAHNDARMAFAFGAGEQAMMVTTRGTFRHSTGALLELGQEPPALGSAGADAATDGNAGAGGSSMGGAAGSASGAAVEQGAAGSANTSTETQSNEGGCGCRTTPTKPASGYGLVAFALAWLVRRRRCSRVTVTLAKNIKNDKDTVSPAEATQVAYSRRQRWIGKRPVATQQ
jgi:MYXO-CTERM domain-containing protein